MKCTVLVFAHLRDAIGKNRLTIDLPDGATVHSALDALASQHVAIARLRDRLAVAVDERFQPRHAPLHDGCTIALIPPVSGG